MVYKGFLFWKRRMNLSLIGMSGSGKTYWSTRLEACGFQRICCDDLVAKQLESKLSSFEGQGVQRVASWMGLPDTDGFLQRERLYLACEAKTMCEVIEKAERHMGASIVIDTTGSVVYMPEEIQRRLRELSIVVNLEASFAEQEALIQRYLCGSKPLVWREHFAKSEGETIEAAVVRCFPRLLDDRLRLYKQFAHLSIPLSQLAKPNLTATDFLAILDLLLSDDH